MEPAKFEIPKLPVMVMCGDHPSFTKSELNVKDEKHEEKDQENEKIQHRIPTSYARISPTTSRTEKISEVRMRTTSEHALRLIEAKRRARSLEVMHRPDVDVAAPANKTLVQAALGSFRWPPYLVAVWVLVLVMTHALHGLVSVLERTLPKLRKLSQYFGKWTEDAWRSDKHNNHRLYPIGLACITGVLYLLYYTLYAVYCVALWSVEPLCSEVDEKQSTPEVMEPKVTNYLDETNSKTNSNVKQ